MQLELTPFKSWLACQYPHSSARKHYLSDLALFFSWAGKPPSEISPHNVDKYIRHCLSKGLSPLTINRRLIMPAPELVYWIWTGLNWLVMVSYSLLSERINL